MCGSINNTLILRRLGRGKPSQRLSSVEDIPKILDFDEGLIKGAKGAENEMTDYERSEVEERTGLGNAVGSVRSKLDIFQ